jgi:CHAT domain-containing protein
LHTLPAAAEVESLVRQHQEAIHGALADPLTPDGAGDKLRRLLVEPVLDSVHPATTVVIVPDGALHGLNFETLPASGTQRRYLIEDVEVQIAPSLALLGRPREALPARSLLVVGNPTPRNPDFPALRYASAEMSSIARHFGGESSRTYQGEQASPREFRSARPEQFSFVHFTAHATANRESRSIQRSSSRGPMMPTSCTRETWRICRCARNCDRLRLPQRGRTGTQARDSSASRGHSCAPAPGAWSRDCGTSTIARPPS